MQKGNKSSFWNANRKTYCSSVHEQSTDPLRGATVHRCCQAFREHESTEQIILGKTAEPVNMRRAQETFRLQPRLGISRRGCGADSGSRQLARKADTGAVMLGTYTQLSSPLGWGGGARQQVPRDSGSSVCEREKDTYRHTRVTERLGWNERVSAGITGRLFDQGRIKAHYSSEGMWLLIAWCRTSPKDQNK